LTSPDQASADEVGKVTVGVEHRGMRMLILMADLDIRVVGEHGETLRHLELDPSVDYQRRGRDIF
jgi:hypothetical protein